MSRIIASYDIHGRCIDVGEIEDGVDDYYDIFEGTECLNEGTPLYGKPTKTSVAKWLEENQR